MCFALPFWRSGFEATVFATRFRVAVSTTCRLCLHGEHFGLIVRSPCQASMSKLWMKAFTIIGGALRRTSSPPYRAVFISSWPDSATPPGGGEQCIAATSRSLIGFRRPYSQSSLSFNCADGAVAGSRAIDSNSNSALVAATICAPPPLAAPNVALRQAERRCCGLNFQNTCAR